jgi:hypothetical protein
MHPKFNGFSYNGWQNTLKWVARKVDVSDVNRKSYDLNRNYFLFVIPAFAGMTSWVVGEAHARLDKALDPVFHALSLYCVAVEGPKQCRNGKRVEEE